METVFDNLGVLEKVRIDKESLWRGGVTAHPSEGTVSSSNKNS